MKEHPRIVFYGTPEFAVPSLAQLVNAGYPVAAVVTAPDKPSGRGLKLTAPPVSKYASSVNIPVLQPVSLKDPEFLARLAEIHPDLQVVVAFRMMPKEVWSLPGMGTFNLHASLLPQYRGAAPINRVIMNGETETGVTTFFLEESMDTGNIIFQEQTGIGPEETAGDLHDRLMVLGSKLVLKTVAAIENGDIATVHQSRLIGPETRLNKAPKIFKEDCTINWNEPVEVIHNMIRGLSPFPAAHTELVAPDKTTRYLKVFRAHPDRTPHSAVPGTVETDGRSYLKVAAKDGFMFLSEVQLSGRKTMGIAEFLRGFGKVFI
jgi:methionyl-tRNA formyltransferase